MQTVVHLIDTGGPGGAETVFANLVRGLDAARWRSVAVVPYEDWLSQNLARSGVRTEILTTTGSFDWRFVVRLIALLRRERAALIQTHLLGPAVYGSIAARLLRLPLVGTFHGWSDISPDEQHLQWKLKLIRRPANRLVFVSNPLRDRVRDAGFLTGATSAVITNGIDLAAFQPQVDASLRAEFGIADGNFVIGSVGNVRRPKGYEVLLQAAALLRERGEGYRFVIVGDNTGVLYDELLQLRRALDLENTVTFAGFRSDVSQVMANFDLHVLASHSEGFSLSTIQAMACGIPVIATRSGGPQEILRDGITGVLVEPGRPDLLADAMQRLRHNPQLRRSLAEAGRLDVASRFALERMIRSYAQLYEECVARTLR